jgi:hypothetical protein
MNKTLEDKIKEVKGIIESDKEIRNAVYIGLGLISLYVLYKSLSSESNELCGMRLLSTAVKIGII